jgi:hypothetical protein
MSIGGNLPYQLRPNKAVDRLLFVDLLCQLDGTLGVGADYKYFTFGGPQLEDCRLVHERFPSMQMLSIEEEAHVLKRQRFNEPHTNVRCKLQTSSDFVSGFSSRQKAVVWLDYTKPSERRAQIAEFQTILKRVASHSIIRITLNAAVSSLGGDPGPGLQQHRLKRFLDEFDRCFPNGLGPESVTTEAFPTTLLGVIDFAAAEALRDRAEWRFQPLMTTAYADGQMMVTATGIAAPRRQIENLLRGAISRWPFASLNWNQPLAIEVPELTLKERIHINQLLPKHQDDPLAIQRKLGFPIEKSVEDGLRKLRNYLSFQRHYPHFARVSI